MEFDKKKIAIGLFSVVVLGGVGTYAAFLNNEPESQITTQSSSQKSVIEKAKGGKSNDSLEKNKKSQKQSDPLTSLAENDHELPSVIGATQDGTKKSIDRRPITQTMAGIDQQARKTAAKAAQPAVMVQTPTAKSSGDQPKKTSTDKKSSDTKDQTPGTQTPGIVTPTQPTTPTNPVNPIIPVDPTPSVSYSALVSVLQEASQLTRSNCTPNSLAAFDAVTKEGYNLLSAQAASQKQIDLHVQRIRQAMRSLQEKADKSVLNDKITTADLVILSNHTPETAKVLSDALESAKVVQTDDNTTQTTVDQINISLQAAIDQLVKRADKTDLDEEIEKAEHLNREIYVPDSFVDLDAALEKAKEVTSDLNASQTIVDQAKAALEQAIAKLQEKEEPEKTLVLIGQLIAECEALVESNYTPQSYQVLSTELTTAKAFVGQPSVTVAAATAQLTALENAKHQLVQRADTAKLQGTIVEAQALAESDYTADSWAALQAVLNGANTLKNDANATQAQIDQKEFEMNHAISALVKK